MIFSILLNLLFSTAHAESLLSDDLKVSGVVVKEIPSKPINVENCPCAQKWMKQALAQNVNAMFSLANCYNQHEEQGMKKDTIQFCSINPKIYSEWMAASATRGFAPAQYAYGTAWFFGSGLPSENKNNAIAWWAQAADQGFGLAYYSLGEAYEEGFGRPKNPKKALALFVEAKKLGDSRAQERITKLEAALKK
jgi:TPR repeat protein